jgi:lipoprotein-releasing system permease protein
MFRGEAVASSGRRAKQVQGWLDKLTDAVAQYAIEGESSPVAVGVAERYPVVFDWLKAHSVNAVVLIVIMMVVLLFNMSSALLIMVLDRTGMIGVLKAQGMRNAAVRRIFLYRSALLFARGALWGNAVALALIAVQSIWQPIKLDASGYMLSVLPIRLELWWWLVLNVAAAVIAVSSMLLPTAIVSRIKPSESLKYRA